MKTEMRREVVSEVTQTSCTRTQPYKAFNEVVSLTINWQPLYMCTHLKPCSEENRMNQQGGMGLCPSLPRLLAI